MNKQRLLKQERNLMNALVKDKINLDTEEVEVDMGNLEHDELQNDIEGVAE